MLNSIKRIFKIGCPLSKRDLYLLKELKNYQVAKGVVAYYRNAIKNNRKDSIDLIQKKLIRNIILGEEVDMYTVFRKFNYGNLQININTGTKTITYLNNRIGHYHFEVNQEKKDWLDWLLKIK